MKFVVVLSFLVQFVAVILALRLIRITGMLWAWLLISGAIILMMVRRWVSFFGFDGCTPLQFLDAKYELIGLLVSVLMAVGIGSIGPFFLSVRKSEEDLKEARDQLEQKVDERTAELLRTNEQLRHEIEDRKGAERERIRTEERLQHQLHFVQTLVDTIPSPIFYKDTLGMYSGCNKAFEYRLGLKRADIVGKSAYDILPADLARQYQEMDLALLESPGEQIYETTLIYADASVHDVIIHKATFTQIDGSLGGLVGVSVDITERKKAEEALRKAHDELEVRVEKRTAELAEANKELRIEVAERKRVEEALRESSEKLKLFAYSVAHDLKSPAIAINGLTKLLQKSYGDALGDKASLYCAQIVKASEHVGALVDNINVFIATKETPLTFETVSIEEILRTVRDEFSSRLSMRQIEWLEPGGEMNIEADKLSILRLFRNLVDNALKYGGEHLSEIKIGYEEREDAFMLSVNDNGVGITKEDTEKIFKLFQRQATARGIDGTGLGLAIVKEIAEKHGGTVWVETAPGRGTTFCVTISKHLPASST